MPASDLLRSTTQALASHPPLPMVHWACLLGPAVPAALKELVCKHLHLPVPHQNSGVRTRHICDAAFAAAAVGALAAVAVFWAAVAAWHAVKRQLLPYATHYRPRIVLSVVLVFFYLYPSVTNIAVSLFTCAMVDDPTEPPTMPCGRPWRRLWHPGYVGRVTPMWCAGRGATCG
jgi:hypothetical protein